MQKHSEEQLDRLLDAWAEHQRLDANRAEAVLRAVLSSPRRSPAPIAASSPEPLPATWWSDLSTQVTAAVVLATAPSGPFRYGGSLAA